MITIDTMILFLIVVIFFYSFEIVCKSQTLKENFSLPFFGDEGEGDEGEGDEGEGAGEEEEAGEEEAGEGDEEGGDEEGGDEILIGGQPLWVVIAIAVSVILLIGTLVYKFTGGDDDDQIGGESITELLDNLL